jgi:hypothetical protein
VKEEEEDRMLVDAPDRHDVRVRKPANLSKSSY